MDYSIIIPIYKVEKYLRESILSVLRQTKSDYELILVNDGSPDNCLAICNEYAAQDDRIIIIDKLNGGLVSARKAGLAVASGKYIISLDGDDYIADNYLETVDNIRAQHGDVDMIIATGYDDYDGKLFEYNIELTGYFDKTKIDKDIIPNCVNGLKQSKVFRNQLGFKIIKNSIIQANIHYYTEKVSMGEDLLLSTACIGDCQSIYMCNEKLYYYRHFAEQMTKVYKKNLFTNEDILIRKLLEVSHKKGMAIDNQLYRHALDIAKSTIYNELRFQKGKEYIRTAFDQIYATELIKLMDKDMLVSEWSMQEKLFAKLLKRGATRTITMLAKIQYKLRGTR